MYVICSLDEFYIHFGKYVCYFFFFYFLTFIFVDYFKVFKFTHLRNMY